MWASWDLRETLKCQSPRNLTRMAKTAAEWFESGVPTSKRYPSRVGSAASSEIIATAHPSISDSLTSDVQMRVNGQRRRAGTSNIKLQTTSSKQHDQSTIHSFT
eukprot:GHVU01049615.1.p1 GENE.GHVU01049615.1~~GHVU01049615.1.p1  ORF type:complete len:104 (-),score=7.79 GHVU01049615.1:2068-2379(-)